MDRARKPWLRGAIALGVMGAMAASLLISPASAHITTFGHLKKHIKKIAKQQIKALAPTLSVASASSADALSTQTKLAYQAAAGSPAQTIFDNGNLKLSAACAAGPAVTFTAETAVNNATINSYGNSTDTTDDDWDTGDVKTLSSSDEERDVVYTTPGGQVIVFQYAANEGTIYDGAAGCIVKGVLQVI